MNYAYELKDISCFVQVARAGSLSRASSVYNIPKASLSQHLRKLEDALGVQLFTRRTKGLELTDAGKKYLELCSAIFDSCENAASAAQRAHSSIGGTIRVVATSEFGTSVLGAAALYFSSTYQDVDFDLQFVANDKIIAGQVDFDCLIYLGEPPDSPLMRRKLGEFSYALYASPSYMERRTIRRIEDVDGVDGVIYQRNGSIERWMLGLGRNRRVCTPHGKFVVNDYWMAKYFAVEGTAIAYLPDFFVKYEVEAGVLVPVAKDWRSHSVPVSIIYSAQKHRIARITKLVEVLCENFDKFTVTPGYSLVSREGERRP